MTAPGHEPDMKCSKGHLNRSFLDLSSIGFIIDKPCSLLGINVPKYFFNLYFAYTFNIATGTVNRENRTLTRGTTDQAVQRSLHCLQSTYQKLIFSDNREEQIRPKTDGKIVKSSEVNPSVK